MGKECPNVGQTTALFCPELVLHGLRNVGKRDELRGVQKVVESQSDAQ